MLHFGYTVSMAFSDIKLKANKVIENKQILINAGYIKENSEEANCLIHFIKFEKAQNLVFLNGSNNKKILAKINKEEWMIKYQSTGFNLLRGGAWLFEYLHCLFKYIGN